METQREKFFMEFTNYTNSLFTAIAGWENYKTINFQALSAMQQTARYNAFLYVSTAASKKEKYMLAEQIVSECDRVLALWEQVLPRINPLEIHSTYASLVADIAEIKKLYIDKYLAKAGMSRITSASAVIIIVLIVLLFFSWKILKFLFHFFVAHLLHFSH